MREIYPYVPFLWKMFQANINHSSLRLVQSAMSELYLKPFCMYFN